MNAAPEPRTSHIPAVAFNDSWETQGDPRAGESLHTRICLAEMNPCEEEMNSSLRIYITLTGTITLCCGNKVYHFILSSASEKEWGLSIPLRTKTKKAGGQNL